VSILGCYTNIAPGTTRDEHAADIADIAALATPHGRVSFEP
jgi:hypothetical protein